MYLPSFLSSSSSSSSLLIIDGGKFISCDSNFPLNEPVLRDLGIPLPPIPLPSSPPPIDSGDGGGGGEYSNPEPCVEDGN